MLTHDAIERNQGLLIVLVILVIAVRGLVEIVPLEAKLPSAIEAEAEEKDCDFVLYATVSHKKGGGGFGFGKALGAVVAQTGGGNWGNTAGNIAGRVAAT